MVGRKERQIVSLTAYLSVRREIIDNRDKEIRLNLAEFVRGQKVREDLKTPGNQSTASTTNDAAATETSLDTADAQAATDELNPYEELTDAPNQELTRSSDDEIALHTAVDLVGLRSAYGDDASVKLVLDHLASRQRNQNVTEIETFVDVLNRAGTPASRSVVIRVFRSLDALGVGRFIPGRKGHATRFEWFEKSLSVRDHATTSNA